MKKYFSRKMNGMNFKSFYLDVYSSDKEARDRTIGSGDYIFRILKQKNGYRLWQGPRK